MVLSNSALLTCSLQINSDVIHSILICGNTTVKTVDPSLVISFHSYLQFKLHFIFYKYMFLSIAPIYLIYCKNIKVHGL